MDNWLPAHRKADETNAPYVMGYHTRADIPFQFALAEAFTICDAYHCSVMGPTWPNRMYWMTGTIDPEGTRGGPMIQNSVPDAGFGWTTYAERLEKAGVSWKVYQQEDNYGCNILELFTAFREAPEKSPLRVKGLTRGPEGQFEYDAMNDKLPAVSWIIPTSHQSEHPDFMPAAGAAFVASKIDAIAANPEVWAKTAFILNYDENDGIFDHVAPPVPPPGTAGEFIEGVPVGGGFRVPCIIVSPWTAGRLGMQPAVGPHIGAAIPGKIHRGQRAEHHRMAAADLWRPRLRLPLRRPQGGAAGIARHCRPLHPRENRGGHPPGALPARRESNIAGPGSGPAQAHPTRAGLKRSQKKGQAGLKMLESDAPLRTAPYGAGVAFASCNSTGTARRIGSLSSWNASV